MKDSQTYLRTKALIPNDMNPINNCDDTQKQRWFRTLRLCRQDWLSLDSSPNKMKTKTTKD